MKKIFMPLAVMLFLALGSVSSHAQGLPSYTIGEWGSTELKVVSANIVEDVLTVTLTLKNNSPEKTEHLDFFSNEAFVIAGGKKFGLLKDQTTGEYMASPATGARRDGDKPGEKDQEFGVRLTHGKGATVWLKFPAPPKGKDIVELLVPEFPPMILHLNRL